MDFDRRIAEIESGIAATRARAEEKCQAILGAAVEFIRDWSKKTVERGVTSKPEVAKRLGVDGLRPLKADLKQLLDGMPDRINQHLGREDLWLHRGIVRLPLEMKPGQLPFGPYEVRGSGVSEKLDASVRELLGCAGALLMKYGLTTGGPRSDWPNDGPKGAVRYGYGYQVSDTLAAACKEYAKVFEELSQLSENLESVRRSKSECEAKGLWEQA